MAEMKLNKKNCAKGFKVKIQNLPKILPPLMDQCQERKKSQGIIGQQEILNTKFYNLKIL